MSNNDNQHKPSCGSSHPDGPKRRRICLIALVVFVITVAAILATVLGITRSKSNGDNDADANSDSSDSDFPATSPTTSSTVVTIDGTYIVLETVPHDSQAFTQGLELVSGNPQQYFQSTGRYGQSSIQRVDLATGMVLQRHNLLDIYFGEGLTQFGGKRRRNDTNANTTAATTRAKVIQITWQKQTAFIYNATNLEVLDVLTYSTTSGQGWGICHVKAENIFYVSDGTQFLHTWDDSTLALVDKVSVVAQSSSSSFAAGGDPPDQPVSRINELEWDYHSETVLANIWKTNLIVRIHPATGVVTHRHDLSDIYLPRPASDMGVLNGIAVTDVPNEIWVTGKLWPTMYLIRLSD